MSAAFSQYVGRVNAAIQKGDGGELRELLGLNQPVAMQAVFEAQQQNPRWDPSSTCSSRLPSPWDEVVAGHCLSLGALLKGNRVEAYDHMKSSVTSFLQAFRQDKEAWVVEPMLGVVRNVRSVAAAGDAELRKAGKKAAKVNDAGSLLQKCFSTALQASNNAAKKLATLEIVNTLFKIYFTLNTLRLCKNLIKSVNSNHFPGFDNFPLSQRVTYKFYVGRLAVFDEDYKQARDFLSYAFANCEPRALANQKLILKYLVPVQMLLGVLPRPAMLAKYQLEAFSDLAQAMRIGSVKLFNDCMEANQEAFIQEGTFLLLEKLKMAIFRRLFRSVAVIHKELEPAKSSQIPLDLFQKALAAQSVDLDLDEVECILANLVYRKYIKGYISHQHRVMVVSKADPFPALEATSLVDIN